MRWAVGFALLLAAIFALSLGYHLGVAYIDQVVARRWAEQFRRRRHLKAESTAEMINPGGARGGRPRAARNTVGSD